MRATVPVIVLAAAALASCRHAVAPRPSAVTLTPTQASATSGARVDVPDEIRYYLNHRGFHWKCNQTPHFLLCYQPNSPAERSIKDLEIIAEEDRSTLLQMISVPAYEPRIYAFFLKSRNDLKKLIGFYGDGRSRPNQHATFYVIDGPRTLAHEMAHEMLSNLWGAAQEWVEEGMAVYTTEFPILDGDVRAYFKAHRLLPLEKLVNPDWVSSMYNADITYTELGSFMKYLDTKYGIKNVEQVWRGGSASVEQVYGKPLAALEKEWLETLSQPAEPSRTLIFRN
ncbi:exported hypothetical protein [Candidatus Sulfopaludibacter sp. SbA3]|nr:exported hypothetical protein [Candidatus Sulfopaludibacter sp. SbA3]